MNINSVNINLRTINARYSWASRRTALAALIIGSNVDIIYLQNCSIDQRHDLRRLFGDDWAWHWSHGCAVTWDTRRWQMRDIRRSTLPGPQWRGFAAVKLSQGEEWIWAASTHLSYHRPDAAFWRKRQTKALMLELPYTDHPWTQIGIGINDRTMPPGNGARHTFAEYGFTSMRQSLDVAELPGEFVFPNHVQSHEGAKYIANMEILCGEQIQPRSGSVLHTLKLTSMAGLKMVSEVDTFSQPKIRK